MTARSTYTRGPRSGIFRRRLGRAHRSGRFALSRHDLAHHGVAYRGPARFTYTRYKLSD